MSGIRHANFAELWRLQSNLGSRLARIFTQEELYGLRTAAQVRTAIGALFLVLVTVFLPADKILYWIACAIVMIATPWVHYFLRRRYPARRKISYLVTFIDFALIVFLYSQPDILTERYVPAQSVLNVGTQEGILLVIASYAFTGRPVLVAWAGISAALSWACLIGFLLSLPDTLTVTDKSWAGQGVIVDPLFVGIGHAIADMAVFVTTALCLSLIVIRLRALVAQHANVERARLNLSRYLPQAMADALAGRDNPFEEPQVRALAVVFVDMVDFTRRIAMMVPVATIALLRDFHRVLAECTFRHGGALEKFLGDGIMATFGRLTSDPQDSVRALVCAQAMVREIGDWTRARGDEPPIEIGVGIHFGEVVLGDIGSDQRLEAAVLGDVVNVASRIEGVSRGFPQPILFSQQVYEAAATVPEGAAILARSTALGEQTIRGHGTPLALYGLTPEPSGP